jgi:hypothetical protein
MGRGITFPIAHTVQDAFIAQRDAREAELFATATPRPRPPPGQLGPAVAGPDAR